MEKAKVESRVAAAILPNPKSRRLDQVREVIQPEHYSQRTEETYVQSFFTKRQS